MDKTLVRDKSGMLSGKVIRAEEAGRGVARISCRRLMENEVRDAYVLCTNIYLTYDRVGDARAGLISSFLQ